ncbi:MAG TPA: PIN domain-containing protein [Thermomicrobiales bacterium]|nr:PIN domain-containing protein [Thermomicrobiales bacterium]
MPESYVIDTDVVSYLFRGDTRAEHYRALLGESVRVVSFVTLAEVNYWAVSRGWGSTRRRELDDYLDQFVVVFSDGDLCEIWARVVHQARRNGRPILPSDAWIAATAISLNVPLITNNLSDYAGVTELQLAHVPVVSDEDTGHHE